MKTAVRNGALVAVAAFGMVGSASAQSSVSLFGVYDATLKYGDTGGSGGKQLWQLGSGGTTSSRIGIKGVEDLGGGNYASFWMESNFAANSGAGLATNTTNTPSGLSPAGVMAWNYRSTVSLSGGWGELRFGRDFVPNYRNYSAFDPWGDNGVSIPVVMPTTSNGLGIIAGTTMASIRASNQIAYFVPPTQSGIYGQASYWFGQQSSGTNTSNDGTGYGARLGYASGPIDVAVGAGHTQYASGDARQASIGGAWKWKYAKVMGLVTYDELGTTKGWGWEISSSVPVGVDSILLSYSTYRVQAAGASERPQASKIAIGYFHNLSKRTAIYATVATVRNRNGAQVVVNGATAGMPNQNSTGVDLGFRHLF
jgi:predicted porin